MWKKGLVSGVAGLGLAATAGAAVVPAPGVVNSATPFNNDFVATNTVDGTELEYASQGLGLDTFIEYAFSTPQTFDRIAVLNRDSPGQSDLIGDFTLTFDGGVTAPVTRSPLRGSSPIHTVGPRTTMGVRLDVDTIGTGDAFNNTGAMEVIFFNTPAGHSVVPATVVGSAAPFNGSFAADNAADGIVGRSGAPGPDGVEYASATLGAGAFIDFDLGALTAIGGFDYVDRIAEEDRVTGFDMIFSTDANFGDPDDAVRSYTKGLADVALGDTFATPVSAQFVRFDVTAHNPFSANTGASEFIFYQIIPEPSAIGLCAAALATLLRRHRKPLKA